MNTKYKCEKFENHAVVTLSNGTKTKIDLDSLWILEKFPSWQERRGYISCERWIDTEFGKVNQKIYLHRIITDPKTRWQVDHADRDKLNNCKSNLRMATPSENSHNKATRSLSGFRGVSVEKRNLKKPFIGSCGKKRKRFASMEEAALFYDSIAKEKYGPFAVLNFP